MQISGQLKSLPIVASLTAERDGELRKAALNSLATGYKIFGELDKCNCFYLIVRHYVICLLDMNNKLY